MKPPFIHLSLHSEYSLIDGLVQIPHLIEKCSNFSMPAVAITDQSNLFATIKFYQEALQNGIKPLIGADVWLNNSKDKRKPFRLTVFCQNDVGYKNLLELISKSFLQGQELDRALVNYEWLKEFAAGLLVLSGGLAGDLGYALLQEDQSEVARLTQFWKDHFPNRYYLELQRTQHADEERYIQKALQHAEQHSLPVVATNQVRFLEQDDFDAHETRVCIHNGYILADPNRPKVYTQQQYFKSSEEMTKLFADIPSAIENTFLIAQRCNVTLLLGKNYLPQFPVPEGFTTESYLIDAAKKGLDARLAIKFDVASSTFLAHRKAYDARLELEIEVINKMGFAGYFLIVSDFTRWARDNDVPVGPGRGSGPGSLVAYALNITDLDPLKHDLLFERFLNPERVSMPDFDIDFCMEGRDRVIEYVMQTHGRESVAQIITYGTMAAKAVVRDVGRVLGLPYGFVDKLAKLIPFELGITLDKALKQEPVLKERYQKEEDVKTLFDLARKLEGTTRNVGKHAGGVVIAPEKLTAFTPLYCENDGAQNIVTQFDKDDVEAVGLVKFDFLGLRTLTIIDCAVKRINTFRKQRNEEILKIDLLPMEDEKSYAMLKACKTTAVFQLESRGMKDLVKRLQPDCFEDIVALVALFRPGPLGSGMVDDFINRKHGRAKVSYPHPKLEPILRPTYGIIVYQEQVMQIAQVLAGYSLGAADLLRRAMGKKKPEEMAMQREIFCKGAVARDVPHQTATSIFDLMEKFADYGFNKSHSASYALIAYQTAWLKSHYPAAFMAAVLSADMDHTDKVVHFVEECLALNLTMVPPDINESNYTFRVLDDHTLVYGLGAIKGVGEAAIELMIVARNADGPFTDLFNFCERLDSRKITRRVIEALIKAGAFDKLGAHRASLIKSIDKALHQADQASHNKLLGQVDLLGGFTSVAVTPYVQCSEWSEQDRLFGEKETLGLYLTGHPIHRYLNELTQFISFRLHEIRPTPKSTATLAGIITSVRSIQTKRGDRMAVVGIDDASGQVDVICFSDVYNQFREYLVKDKLIIIEGEVNIDDFSGGYRVLSRNILSIDEARNRFAKSLQIRLHSGTNETIAQLAKILESHRGGNCPVVIDYARSDATANLALGEKWKISPTDNLLQTLRTVFSEHSVAVVY